MKCRVTQVLLQHEKRNSYHWNLDPTWYQFDLWVIETLMLTCFYIFECSISVRGASYNLQSQNLLYTSVPLYSYSKPLWIHVLVEGNWYTKTWRQFQLKSERGRWQQDVDNAGQRNIFDELKVVHWISFSPWMASVVHYQNQLFVWTLTVNVW